MKKDLAYEVITNRIIDQLEKGEIPWRKPWATTYPENVKSKKQYNGINLLHLATLGYECNVFGTYKQIKELGGTVKRGEKGYPIVFWKFIEKSTEDDDETKIKKIPFLRYYTVFNLEQTEGIDIPKPVENEIDSNVECERIIENMRGRPNIDHGHLQAGYNPKTDTVIMPYKTRFSTMEGYYSVLFHELTHSTGHRMRLYRPAIHDIRFGSELYSEEELVAEIGAAFLCGKAQIENQKTIENTSAYINHWLQKLKDDKKLVVSAASKAQKAVDYIIGEEKQNENNESKRAA